jgi:uncharacterized protein YlxW (UPF0749 family)
MAEAPAVPGPRPPGRGPDLPEHVTVPLLSLITQRSLDADYEHVAARRRATGAAPAAHPVPRRTAGLVLLVFGLLVTVAAVQTSRNASASDASRDLLIDQINLRRDGLSTLQQRLHGEETRVLALQSRTNQLRTEEQAARARVQRLGVPTGFGAVKGPGIQVTVNSAPDSAGSQLVRDSDLTLLTDALWAAGAEAISVNGQRLTVLSAFRNVGIGVLVNAQPISPPYVFDVIGNPGTMPASLLSSPVGEKWYSLKNGLGFRFDVRNGGTMSLPAAPQPQLREAQVASEDDGHTRTQMGDSGS